MKVVRCRRLAGVGHVLWLDDPGWPDPVPEEREEAPLIEGVIELVTPPTPPPPVSELTGVVVCREPPGELREEEVEGAPGSGFNFLNAPSAPSTENKKMYLHAGDTMSCRVDVLFVNNVIVWGCDNSRTLSVNYAPPPCKAKGQLMPFGYAGQYVDSMLGQHRRRWPNIEPAEKM